MRQSTATGCAESRRQLIVPVRWFYASVLVQRRLFWTRVPRRALKAVLGAEILSAPNKFARTLQLRLYSLPGFNTLVFSVKMFGRVFLPYEHDRCRRSIGQAHAGDGRISSECELWKSFLHHHLCGSRLHRENSTGISLNLRISHGKMARTRAENSRMS